MRGSFVNASTYLRRQAYLDNIRYEQNRFKGQPQEPASQGEKSLLGQVSDAVTSVTDWVDIDSLASTLIPEHAALVGTLNVLDGANETYRQSQAQHRSALTSTLKVGLAAASAVPGLAGNLAETALAALEVKEGAQSQDTGQVVTTVTRLATSLGADLVALGVGGPAGAAIALAAAAGRVGYKLYSKAE